MSGTSDDAEKPVSAKSETGMSKSSHMIERAAQKLGSVGDLSLPPAPLQRVAAPIQAAGLDAATIDPPAISEAPPEAPSKPAARVAAPPMVSPTIATSAPTRNGAASPVILRNVPGMIDLATLSAAGLVVSGNIRTRISEEYRIAVSRILRASRGKRPGAVAGELLMVTSARPGEGKSFTAINLAGAIAHNVMRPTVLVDIDFKKKSISNQLGLSERVGLLDVASTSGQKIEDLIVPTAIEHLSVLPVGRDSGEFGENADGTSRRPVSQVIERLARRFPDHIFILDLPPCLSTSDPSTLAPVVNEIIMVVEAERTQRNEVEAALDLVKLCPKITLLLNKIRTTTSNTFGAYDYYGSYS
jgi:protein-tyrosine kinase